MSSLMLLNNIFGISYKFCNYSRTSIDIKVLVSRCFPHIVNLACKAVLGAITKLEYAKENAADFVPNMPAPTTFEDVLRRDPVATTRSLIRGVSENMF